jgi:hypothetical protein
VIKEILPSLEEFRKPIKMIIDGGDAKDSVIVLQMVR